MIAILPIDIIRSTEMVEDLFEVIGNRISTLVLTSFSELSRTGQAVMLDLHDVFRQSIQQEVSRARDILHARYPSMNIVPDRGLWNEQVDFSAYPNDLGRIVLLLYEHEVETPLNWLRERGLKSNPSVWLLSWRKSLEALSHKKELDYSLKEVKMHHIPFDFRTDEFALRKMLPDHVLKASAGAGPDFGMLCWKFDGALPSSLEKVLRDSLVESPLVITHLLPDIRQ
jgi:hypothetical protein